MIRTNPLTSSVIRFGILLLTLAFITSCRSTSTYLKTAPNTPLLEEVGDVKAVGHIGWNHGEMGLAVAPAKHIGLIGNLYGEIRNRQAYEFGAGYWTNFGQTKTIFEAYSGFGRGFVSGEYTQHWDFPLPGGSYDIDYFDIEADYNKYFVQFNIAQKLSKWATLGASMKHSYVHYPRYKYHFARDNYSTGGGAPIIGTDTIDQSNVRGLILDPVVFLRWRVFSRMHLQAQLGYSFSNLDIMSNYVDTRPSDMPEGDLSNLVHPRFQRLTMNFGLSLSLGRINKSEKKGYLPPDNWKKF